MITSLQHQLDMIWRTENPNYIILLKNKANKDMNFEDFKVVQTKEQDKLDEKKEARYFVGVDPIRVMMGAEKSLIVVLDRLENKIVLTAKCRVEGKDKLVKRVTSDYRKAGERVIILEEKCDMDIPDSYQRMNKAYQQYLITKK